MHSEHLSFINSVGSNTCTFFVLFGEINVRMYATPHELHILEMSSGRPKLRAKCHQKSKVRVSSVSLTAALQLKCHSIDPSSALPCKEEKKHGSLKPTVQVLQVFQGNFTFLTSFQFSDLFAGVVTDWIHSWQRLLPESKCVTTSEQRLCSPS